MDETIFEKIEQYLSGELSYEERSRFESEVAVNKKLASMLKLYQSIDTEMAELQKSSEEEKELRKTLNHLNTIYFNTEEKRNPDPTPLEERMPVVELEKNHSLQQQDKRSIPFWKKLAVAAGIAGLVALGVTWYVQNTKTNQQIAVETKKTDSSVNRKPETIPSQKNTPPPYLTEENKNKPAPSENRNALFSEAKANALFASNFTPDNAPEDKSGPLEDAFAYYEDRDYKNAVAAINSADLNLVERGQQTDKKQLTFFAHYYKAQSELAEKNVTAAITELKKALVVSPDVSSRIKTQWSLALAYLKAGAVRKAQESLKLVADNNHETEYKLKAEALLKELAK